MDFKLKKPVLALLGAFLVVAASALAAVTVGTVTIAPESPDVKDDLACSFSLGGDAGNYDVSLSWLRDSGSGYINQESQAREFSGLPTEVTVTDTLPASATAEGDKWKCMVQAQGSAAGESSAVTIQPETKIVISYIDAKCDPKCDDDDLDAEKAMNGNAGKITDVKPGAELTLKFRVESLWPDDTDDHDIDDIELECVLEEIEDTDEIDESIEFDDLDPGDESSREEMVFEISEEAQDDEIYTIECTLTAEDEDGSDYEFEFDIDVEVKKEKHDLVFTSVQASPGVVSCNRDFSVSYKIKNIGSSDEDDARIEMRSGTLDIYYNEILPEIEEGDYDDDDTEYSRTVSFTADDSVKAGTYEIRLDLWYDSDDENEIWFVELIVQNCNSPVPEDEPKDEPEEEEPPVVVIEQPPIQPTQQPTPVVSQPVEETVAFEDSVWFIALLVVAILLLLALAIWLIAMAFKK